MLCTVLAVLKKELIVLTLNRNTCPTVQVWCMSNSTGLVYVQQYRSGVCPTVQVWCMSNSTCLVYVQQYRSDVCPTVQVWCMSNSTGMVYVQQYRSSVCPTVQVWCMSNSTCLVYVQQYRSGVCPTVQVWCMSNSTGLVFNLIKHYSTQLLSELWRNNVYFYRDYIQEGMWKYSKCVWFYSTEHSFTFNPGFEFSYLLLSYLCRLLPSQGQPCNIFIGYWRCATPSSTPLLKHKQPFFLVDNLTKLSIAHVDWYSRMRLLQHIFYNDFDNEGWQEITLNYQIGGKKECYEGLESLTWDNCFYNYVEDKIEIPKSICCSQ